VVTPCLEGQIDMFPTSMAMSRWSQLSALLLAVFVLFLGAKFYLEGGRYLAPTASLETVQLDSVELALDLKGLHAKCISSDQHGAIKVAVDKVLTRIWRDWNVSNYPLFLSYMHIPPLSWELQKNRFIALLLEANPKKKYVVGFSGSSVTAGHDSYFAEAFPQVFSDNLVEVFRLAGIELVVRNQALGNNPCYPYDACMETHMVCNCLFCD
jgi:hypothetical protein